MKRKQIAQVNIADHLGVSTSTINAWIHGRNPVTPERLTMFAEFLGCTVDQLREKHPKMRLGDEERPEQTKRVQIVGMTTVTVVTIDSTATSQLNSDQLIKLVETAKMLREMGVNISVSTVLV